MSATPWRVQIERTALDAASPAAVAAIERENVRARLPGLDDALNPQVIDVAKWRALVASVDASALHGKPLFLDPVGLRIAASSPTHPEAFGAATRFTAGDTVGQAILARTDAAYDCALAAERTRAARQRTEAATQQIDRLDAQRNPAASEPRLLRYRAALAWRENAAAAAACAPHDEAAKSEAAAAAKAATTYQMLGGNMG